MIKRRLFSIITAALFALIGLSCFACSSKKQAETEDKNDNAAGFISNGQFSVGAGNTSADTVSDLAHFDLDKYLEPIFEGNHVYNETAMMLKDKNGKLPTVSLYYPITEIVSVRNYALDVLYQNGKDYVLNNGKITIPDGSAIYKIACPYNEYYIDTYVNDGSMWPLASGSGAQMRTETEYGNLGLTKYQIAVTYKHSGTFGVQSPADKSAKLPKTNAKLMSGENMSIVCLGDSISAGWSASGYGSVCIKPFMPQYFNLVSTYLKENYNENIVSTNLSVGGQTSTWGAEAKQTGNAIAANPDLMFIGFGMNEGVDPNFTPAYYKTQIKSIIDQVRAKCPNTEFVLVESMMPNAEVAYNSGKSVLQNQGKYLAPLLELENEYQGVAVADINTIHVELLNRKAFRDMSTNNINHPNDFVQRLYAQIALRTIIGK